MIKQLPPITPTPLSVWIDTCAQRYNIPAEVIYFVGWHESHMGESPLAKRTNNMFGIRKNHSWARYDSKHQSVEDFCKFLLKHYPNQIGQPAHTWVLWGYRGKGKHWRVK
jgi:flagellum-specific peptidoglycan hydrolase FlgJ